MGCAVVPLSPHRPSPRSSTSGPHICSPLHHSSHQLLCATLCHTTQPWIPSAAPKPLPPLLLLLHAALHPSRGGAGRAEGNSSLVPGRFRALTLPPLKYSHFQEAGCVRSPFPQRTTLWSALARVLVSSSGLSPGTASLAAVGRAGGSSHTTTFAPSEPGLQQHLIPSGRYKPTPWPVLKVRTPQEGDACPQGWCLVVMPPAPVGQGRVVLQHRDLTGAG